MISSTDAERKTALEWLDNACRTIRGLTKAWCEPDVAITLRAMLAEPRLPAEPSAGAIQAIRAEMVGESPFAIYDGLYEHLSDHGREEAPSLRAHAEAAQVGLDAMRAHGLVADEEPTQSIKDGAEQLRKLYPSHDARELREAIAYYKTAYPGDGSTDWHHAFVAVFKAAEAHLATLPAEPRVSSPAEGREWLDSVADYRGADNYLMRIAEHARAVRGLLEEAT